MYRKLVYEEQSAVAAQAQLLLLEGPSIGFLFGVANQGKDVKDVAKSIRAVVDGLAAAPPSKEELDKVRNTIVSRLVTGRQTMQEKADNLGAAASLLGDPARYNTELAKYQAVIAGGCPTRGQTVPRPSRPRRASSFNPRPPARPASTEPER